MYNLKNVEKYLSKEEMEYCIDILHKYDENVDDSHNSHHIIPVINTMMKMYHYHKKCVNMKMCIFIALLHDVGLTINPDRKIHHLTSKEFVLNDENLKKFFNDDEINTIAIAVSEHRSSINTKTTLYSSMISDADTLAGYNIRKIINRSYKYNINNGCNENEIIDKMYDHLVKKYGHGGYNKFCLPESLDMSDEYTEEMQYFLSDKDRFTKLVNEVIIK